MSNPHRSSSGYGFPPTRGYSNDPRMSQQQHDPRISRQSSYQQPYYQPQMRQSGYYPMSGNNTPPHPPTHRQHHSPSPHYQQQHRTMEESRRSYDQHHHHRSQQQHRITSGQGQSGRPMHGQRPPQAQYNANNNMAYRQGSVSRSRSLSRPERQRPRQGMLNRTPSQHRAAAGVHLAPGAANPQAARQPMSPAQLQQQKLQQQRAAGLTAGGGMAAASSGNAMHMQSQQPPLPPPKDDDDEEDKPPVRTTLWGWIAFLVTCCYPPVFIRVVFRKENALMQQAWREKVHIKHLVVIGCTLMVLQLGCTLLHHLDSLWCSHIYHCWLGKNTLPRLCTRFPIFICRGW